LLRSQIPNCTSKVSSTFASANTFFTGEIVLITFPELTRMLELIDAKFFRISRVFFDNLVVVAVLIV
jgi:hypothetical protein